MRRLAVVLFALGLLRVLWCDGAASAQYPWSPTKTPTRRPPTPRPTVAPPSPTPTYYVPTYTPVPPATATPRPPIPTVPASVADLTVMLGNCITGATSRALGPTATVEVLVSGTWRRIRAGAPGGCWVTDDGYQVALGDSPFVVRWTGTAGAREEMDGRDGEFRTLAAELVPGGAAAMFGRVSPPVVLASRRYTAASRSSRPAVALVARQQ